MEWRKINRKNGEIITTFFYSGMVDYSAQGYCDIEYIISNCTDTEHGAKWVLMRKPANGETITLAGFMSLRDAKVYAETVNNDFKDESQLGRLILKIRMAVRMGYTAADKETAERLNYKLGVLTDIAKDVFDLDDNTVFSIINSEFKKCEMENDKNDFCKEKLPT